MTQWTLELWEDEVGVKTWVEDATKEAVFTHSVSKAKARAKAKVGEIDVGPDRPGIS